LSSFCLEYQSYVEEGLAKIRAEAQEKANQKGFEEGKKLAHAISQSKHETLSNCACDLQIKLANTPSDLHTKLADTANLLAHSSRKEFEATAIAADFVVQCQQRLVSETKGLQILLQEVQRSEELLLIVVHQAGELEELCKIQSSCQTTLLLLMHSSLQLLRQNVPSILII
jgi:hypothetical protein